MDVLVIGLGSMGKRRIRLMRNHFPDISICGVDLSDERRVSCEETFGIRTCSTLEQALDNGKYEIAFICTSPLTHSKLISACLDHCMHIFTELNLVPEGYAENIRLAEEKNRILFLSSTLLYREETKYIIDRVNNAKCLLNYNYHVGQYLPDWHPWESFQDYFIGKKETNGCREILAIDLPWIIRAFGKIKSIHVSGSKMSTLDISYNDNYLIMLTHETGHKGFLTVDVVARSPVRKFEVYGEELQIDWLGEPDTLQEYDMDKKEFVPINTYQEVDRLSGYASQIIENEYLDEIKAFFTVLDGSMKAVYTFEDDLYVLDLIDQIEGND